MIFGVKHFLKYTRFQYLAWVFWTVSELRVRRGDNYIKMTKQAATILGFLTKVLGVFPGVFNVMCAGASKWVCEQVEVYREAGVCATLDL